MGNDYEKATDTLMKDVKDLGADMKGILSALQRKAGDYVDSAKESLHESVAERVGPGPRCRLRRRTELPAHL